MSPSLGQIKNFPSLCRYQVRDNTIQKPERKLISLVYHSTFQKYIPDTLQFPHITKSKIKSN